MMHIKNFEEFKKEIEEKELKKYVRRFRELAGINLIEEIEEDPSYFIQVTFEPKGTLLEHETFTFFQKTNNRYCFHPEMTNPPVEGHYHIKASRGSDDLYAVNMSGNAHHKRNRGYEVPRKEADELRQMGVKIPTNNIIESIEDKDLNDANLISESITEKCLCLFIKIM
jgi:hypothetical protein